MSTNLLGKIILGIFFLALLATPYAIEQMGKQSGNTGNAVNKEEAMKRYGFYLQEVSEDVGVDFVHKAPQLDPKLEHIMPQIASVGASVSVVDFNNDG